MIPDLKDVLLASDVEAKGFWDVVHTPDDIHCFCSIDVDTNSVYLFHNYPEFDGVEVYDRHDDTTHTLPVRTGTLEEGLAFWELSTKQGCKLIVHNAMTYDRPIIDKVWPDNEIPFKSWHDTFNQSKRQWYERPAVKGCKGVHGLEPWGKRVGIDKPPITDWSVMTAFILHRVIEDCEIQKLTYLELERERMALKQKMGIDFSASVYIEDLYAKECQIQEVNGILLDVDHYEQCLVDWDVSLVRLTHEIEPLLPFTVKGNPKKLSRKEIAEALGFDSTNVQEKWNKKKKDGEVVDMLDKPFHAPTTKYEVTVKTNVYSATSTEHGFTPKFTKKRDLTGWIKENHPSKKPVSKEWEIECVKEEIKLVNKVNCTYFDIEETQVDLIGGPFTKVSFEPSRMTQPEKVKGFLIKLGLKHCEEWNLKKSVYGGFVKAEHDTEVRWPPKAAPENQIVKQIKAGQLLVSSPQLSEGDYDQLPEGVGQTVAEFNTTKHRRGFVENTKDPDNKGLLSYLREDGRVSAGVNNFATRSGRGTQRKWVNAPSESAMYGKEIRSGLIAGPGKVLVGIDMKSAQLSIAAYYANNWAYYNTVASGRELDNENDDAYIGESSHCVNARMFGLVSDIEWKEAILNQQHDLLKHIGLMRKKSKAGSFLVIFGGAGDLLASKMGIPKNEGNEKKESFMREMGLDKVNRHLKDVLQPKYKRAGGWYLPIGMNYWVWNNSPHKNLNSIVQGAEALCQKLAVIRASQQVIAAGLGDKAMKILDVHDEQLWECDEIVAKQVGEIVCKAYTWAADQWHKDHMRNPSGFAGPTVPTWPIDLDGGYKIGPTYYSVH